MTAQLFDRVCQVRFGTSIIDLPTSIPELNGVLQYRHDEGPRISFNLTRSIRSEPDAGTLTVYNMSDDMVQALKSDHERLQFELKDLQGQATRFPGRSENGIDDKERARLLRRTIEGFIIEVYAGYEPEPALIFRGNITKINDSFSGPDRLTVLELGDSHILLENQWQGQAFGLGATPANVLKLVTELSSLNTGQDFDSMIQTVAPNAAFTPFDNGYTMAGRPLDVIDEIADMLDVQWWVKDGHIVFLRRGVVLPDFAVLIDAKSNAMSISEANEFGDIEFTAFLTPEIHPGRGVVLREEDGRERKVRVLETNLIGDTHGAEWKVQGVGSVVEFEIPLVLYAASQRQPERKQ